MFLKNLYIFTKNLNLGIDTQAAFMQIQMKINASKHRTRGTSLFALPIVEFYRFLRMIFKVKQ